MSNDDQLCENCAPVPLYSLFTGPRQGDDNDSPPAIAKLGTLQDSWTNADCPLCRLVKQIIQNDDIFNKLGAICDPADILCELVAQRVDCIDEMQFADPKTCNKLATRLEIQFSGLDHTSDDVKQDVRRFRPGAGIQLLSPGSVDPARPLQNGYRASTMDESLRLLGNWLKGCEEHHRETCRFDDDVRTQVSRRIRAIDVRTRHLVEIDSGSTRYTTLSYVWGTDSEAYMQMAAEMNAEHAAEEKKTLSLPREVPKIIEDGIRVCQVLTVPYLWVDLYCIDQINLTRKAAEIDAMGHIYRSSYVTLVAGRTARELIPTSTVVYGDKQRVEKIGDQFYINQLDLLYNQIWLSAWIKRSWTFQEGHLASRVAFFGESDVSFMCGGGHWRESLHSGVHGHDVNIPDVNLASSGFHVLGGHKWLRTAKWHFRDYERIVLNYSRRRLTYESDKLAALTGCLKLIGEKKDLMFLNGLPSVDFHYALLWHGEDGPRREGFPSWSWAGWVTSMNVTYLVRPEDEISAKLEPDPKADGKSLVYRHREDKEFELQGLLLHNPEVGWSAGRLWNVCKQQLANIRTEPPFSSVTIESEAARFYLAIVPESPDCKDELCRALRAGPTGSSQDLEAEKTYDLPWNSECGICLRDQSGNLMRYNYAWLSRWPLFSANMPQSLSGSELGWLMRDGLDLIRIVDITLLTGYDRLRPFRHVLSLGIDRSEGVAGRCRRMGMYCIPGEAWDKAGPKKMTVELW
ncbi:heterokaryon incompatibility protein-domain-containing protein [Apodospora peruviana]|uniref:Heterokaryon incompatibility protein-domain-containing protein n=1 Tax=Apodospora peruviana TaxID=516989 RepID=A0AAE0M4B5_9PEZI|nr:heterokaryon incompatibility protein-domain-containing protein [Apodospora peruviana]